MLTYLGLPIYAYLSKSTYINIITFDNLPTYVNLPTPTNLHQHTYLPVFLPTHTNPSSIFLPVPIPKYQYIISADPGAGIGLVVISSMK